MDMNEAISTDNGRKLDRLIQLLEGEPGAPGVVSRLATLEHTVNGDNNTMGIATKVTVMWRIHIWVLCTLSGVAGYFLKTLAENHHLFAWMN